MLYKCLVCEQDSRFVTASGRSPAPRGRGAPHRRLIGAGPGTDSVRNDLALAAFYSGFAGSDI